MLRSLSIRRSVSLVQMNFSTAPSSSSLGSSILLNGMVETTTESGLAAALKGIDARKIDLEPGCSLHFLSQTEADVAASVLGKKYKTEIASAKVPSVLFRNLPFNTSVDHVLNTFKAQQPKYVHLTGGLTVEAIVVDAASALRASRAVEKIVVEGRTLRTKSVKLSDNTFSVKVFNLPSAMTTAEAEKIVLKELSNDQSLNILSLTSTSPAPKSLSVRLAPQHKHNLPKISAALGKVAKVETTSTTMKRPAVVLHKVGFMTQQQVEELFAGFATESVQLSSQFKDHVDNAVAYFSSEDEALRCATALKNLSVNEKKLAASYREFAQPAVRLTNLPADATEQEVRQFAAAVDVVRVVMDESTGDVGSALVLLPSPRHVELAQNALNKKVMRNRRVAVAAEDVNDIEITLSSSSSSSSTGVEEEVREALRAVGVTPKNCRHQSNLSAFVDFATIKDATAAQASFVAGKVSPAEGKTEGPVTSVMSVSPAYVLQVAGLSGETPASSVVESLRADKDAASVNILKVDRNALVKCKRAKDVVGSLTAIKKMRADGSLQVTAHKYKPLQKGGETEYDLDQPDEMAQFDRFSLVSVLKDYMNADPATRYEIAWNCFERSLNDAKVRKEVKQLLETNAPQALQDEVAALLDVAIIANEDPAGNERDDLGELPPLVETPEQAHAKKRLFQIYLQREDMRRLSRDFRDIEAFLGPANPADLFDWSQFSVDHDVDIAKMKEEAKKLEARHAQKMLEALRGKNRNDPKLEGQDKAVAEQVVIKGESEGEKDEVVSLMDPSRLTDHDGTAWSGVILDTDMVQKTMPGQRVLSHRALVMIGNMRGAGGYGKGRGQTPGDALNSAFRAALRNVIHIDLYDNFGLAHDLHGKHNSCHAYIKATPATRAMVGSSFANQVLTRFGIGSASCKLVGRRDPYAMIMAIFNAIGQHENIDEFAKDRGKRYLTLRWGHNNKV